MSLTKNGTTENSWMRSKTVQEDIDSRASANDGISGFKTGPANWNWPIIRAEEVFQSITPVLSDMVLRNWVPTTIQLGAGMKSPENGTGPSYRCSGPQRASRVCPLAEAL